MTSNKNKSEATFGNIPKVNVNEAVKMLSDMYGSAISKGGRVDLLPSVMLWGPPGVGKSQAIRQLADRIGILTGKHVNVTDVRLLLFNPIDLRGIPTANDSKTQAIWLKPQIFDMDPSKEVINILFLDEISAAPQSVQAAAYQITLDHTVGEHKLPDNCIVIAAGNRVTDKSVAYKMPKALANRLLHLEIDISVAAWKEWAVKHRINEKVIGFISFKQQGLMHFDPSNDDLAFATPRAWEMVSNLLDSVNGDVEAVFSLIAGVVGLGTAVEFRAWTRVYNDLPSIENIFDGGNATVPKQPDALYALISSMVIYASEHRDELDRIANSIRYAEKLPADFSAVLIKDYLSIEDDYKSRLMNVPEFAKWLNSKGALLNGMN